MSSVGKKLKKKNGPFVVMIHDITYSTFRLIIIEVAHENDHRSAYGNFFYQFGQKIHKLKFTHNSTAKSKCALP